MPWAPDIQKSQLITLVYGACMRYHQACVPCSKWAINSALPLGLMRGY
jgi:hypothetical protein